MTRAIPVFLGLGSNVGDRRATLVQALRAINALDGVDLVRVSHAYETEPVGPPQPRYLNAAAELSVSIGARELLSALQTIERALGRVRSPDSRWGPRTIDLDILLVGESIIDEPGLAVPHPLLAVRPFVLVPLAEIAPNVRHPGSNRSIRSLLESLPADASHAPHAIGAITLALDGAADVAADRASDVPSVPSDFSRGP